MLTYESIREFEMKEKEATELQKLPEDFLVELTKYKERKKGTDDEKLIDRAIERLFKKREEKLLKLSIYASRADIQINNLMPEEEKALNDIVRIIKDMRKNIINVKYIKKNTNKDITKDKIDKIYTVTKTLPAFVGPDMKIYKIKKGDIVSLPKVLNGFLLRKGIIKMVNLNENT